MGLTTMDYTTVSCPEAEAILKTCIIMRLNEAMDEEYVRSVGAAVRKVSAHYAV